LVSRERPDRISDPNDIACIFLDLVEQLGVMRAPVQACRSAGSADQELPCTKPLSMQEARRMKIGHYVNVDGIRTHYLEAGDEHRGKRPSVLLLHSAEFGGCAEFTWEHNLTPLGKEFHVLAPDLLGFGLTDKVFDFGGQFEKRITHIRQLHRDDVRGAGACCGRFDVGRSQPDGRGAPAARLALR
jgi:hypothetical protein